MVEWKYAVKVCREVVVLSLFDAINVARSTAEPALTDETLMAPHRQIQFFLSVSLKLTRTLLISQKQQIVNCKCFTSTRRLQVSKPQSFWLRVIKWWSVTKINIFEKSFSFANVMICISQLKSIAVVLSLLALCLLASRPILNGEVLQTNTA